MYHTVLIALDGSKNAETVLPILEPVLRAEQAKAVLSRYFSPNLAELIANDPAMIEALGERRFVTFLFTDLTCHPTDKLPARRDRPARQRAYGRRVPVGPGVEREAFGLVVTLPHSGPHATAFTLGRTVRGPVGCLMIS